MADEAAVRPGVRPEVEALARELARMADLTLSPEEQALIRKALAPYSFLGPSGGDEELPTPRTVGPPANDLTAERDAERDVGAERKYD